jgi:HEXXH motif-containing protein
LADVPSLLTTLCFLIRALHLHLFVSGDDETDISFSEPNLPISVFISVPGPGAIATELRIAEALIHEAVHLQLIFIESIVPLVKLGERTCFSPWKNEYRTPQGVLHALYDFRVIDAFLDLTSRNSLHGLTPLGYVQERRATIARQVQENQSFGNCDDLKLEGSAFAERLLR